MHARKDMQYVDRIARKTEQQTPVIRQGNDSVRHVHNLITFGHLLMHSTQMSQAREAHSERCVSTRTHARGGHENHNN